MLTKDFKFTCTTCGHIMEAYTDTVLKLMIRTHEVDHKLKRFSNLVEMRNVPSAPAVQTAIVKRDNEPLNVFDKAFLKDVGVEAW
jgi:hypothetical protein